MTFDNNVSVCLFQHYVLFCAFVCLLLSIVLIIMVLSITYYYVIPFCTFCPFLPPPPPPPPSIPPCFCNRLELPHIRVDSAHKYPILLLLLSLLLLLLLLLLLHAYYRSNGSWNSKMNLVTFQFPLAIRNSASFHQWIWMRPPHSPTAL